MLVRTFRNAVLALLIVLPISVSSAADVEIDILAATPVGSWMMSEDIETDHRGRQAVTVMKHSMLGTEQRNGQTLYWVETVIDGFELKNGERKRLGERGVLKALVGEAFFMGDPENLSMDLKSNYVELIIQTGNGESIRLRRIGEGMAGILGGMEFTQSWEWGGFEAVTVPAGTFHTQKILGSGTMTSLFLGATTSAHTIWYTQSVPFGVMKSEVRTTDKRGKVDTLTIRLLEYGTSGAHSLITSTPKGLPPLPDPLGLFGG